jgi:two-component system, chemotaxis family, protein-glutamate methylesterase/glutaminase
MSVNQNRIVVVGGSAGVLEALDTLVAQLPTALHASIFIVQHMGPDNTGQALLHRLGKYRSFEAKLADHAEVFEPGRIYIARPDYHLLVKQNRLLVTKGARENRLRPGIDPLFRSAAVNHGSAVIGVILTGMLNDGTAGVDAIRRCGGITIVQDPGEATYPEMPQSALSNLKVHHCVPVSRMGALLEELTLKPLAKHVTVPEDIRTEAEIRRARAQRCRAGEHAGRSGAL